MRACFLGQNVCALGFGVAMVQNPPLEQAYGQPSSQPLEAWQDRPPAPEENPMQNRMVQELRRQMAHLS